MLSVDPNLLKHDNRNAQQFFERLVEQAAFLPGVTSAALTRYMPLDGGMPSETLVPEGVQLPAGKEGITIGSSVVDEHFFDTIGIPIVKGRGFRATDSRDAPAVAVFNEVLADRYWARRGSNRQALSPRQRTWTVGGNRWRSEDQQTFVPHRTTSRVRLLPLQAASLTSHVSADGIRRRPVGSGVAIARHHSTA